MKNIKQICCFAFLGVLFLGVLCLVSFCLSNFYYNSLSFHGFALDSRNLLYIGKDNAIEVYNGKEKVFDINPQSSRAYAFTISNDVIILSTSDFVYKIDLDGNVIEKDEDVNSKTYTDTEKAKKHFVTDNNEYFLKSNFGRYKITDKNNTVLFEMPAAAYAFKLLFIVSLIILLIYACAVLIKSKKRSLQ